MEEGHDTRQDVVVAPSPGGLVMNAGEDVIPVDIVGPLAGATPIVGSQSAFVNSPFAAKKVIAGAERRRGRR